MFGDGASGFVAFSDPLNTPVPKNKAGLAVHYCSVTLSQPIYQSRLHIIDNLINKSWKLKCGTQRLC